MTAEPLEPMPLDPSRFDTEYKLKMVLAYPVIAQMTAEQWWNSDLDQREEAFVRVLNAKNLRRTHILYLDDRKPLIPGGSLWTPEMMDAAARRQPTEDDGEDAEYFARSKHGNDWRMEP